VVLPLTLAILDGMSVRVGRETFILPVSAVIESLQPRAGDLHGTAGDDLLLKVREDYLPIVAVHRVMGVADACTDATRAIAVVVQGRGRRYALLVDELVGQQQVVVKNLETNYRKVPGVSAATIMGDGSVALILDVNDLGQLGANRKENGIPADNPVMHASHRRPSRHESRSIH
jgi:two-component system chemotaxis sensor kinase CheA